MILTVVVLVVVIITSYKGFCTSVCLLARLLKNACMDLDEMLRVDSCWDMDELINFWARSGSQSGCQNRIAFCDIVPGIGYGTLQPCLGCQWAVLLHGILWQGKSHVYVWRCAARASRGFKWFCSLSHRKTFVGGKCTLPTAPLVINNKILIIVNQRFSFFHECPVSCVHYLPPSN